MPLQIIPPSPAVISLSDSIGGGDNHGQDVNSVLDTRSAAGGPAPSQITVEETWSLRFWLYAFLGAGLLFPFNALITAVDYLGAVFPHQHVERLITVAYFGPCLLTLIW